MARILGHELITITELNSLAQQMATDLSVVQVRLDKLKRNCIIAGIVITIFMVSVFGFLLFKH